MTKLDKAIRKIIYDCLNLSTNESLLIVVDKFNRKLGRLIYESALQINKNTILSEINLNTNHEPPPSLIKMMMHIDACIIVTSKCLYYNNELKTACYHGSRILFISNLSLDDFARSINTDYKFIIEKSQLLADLLTIGKIIDLTTPAGTNIKIAIKHCKAEAGTGIVHNAGIYANMPAGEAFISPAPKHTNGIVIVDGSLGGFNIIKNPIKLRIKNGYVEQIMGSYDAQYLRKKIKPFGKQARNLIEFGIGTNPKAVITGKSKEDIKVLGTVHITIGNTMLEDSKNFKKWYIDLVLKNSTVKIDQHIIIKNGQLLV